MYPPIDSPLHSHTGREPDRDRGFRLAGAGLVLRRVPRFLLHGFLPVSDSFLVRRPAAPLLLPPLAPLPLPVRPLEVLPARLVLGDDVVEGLTLGGGRLADLARAEAPDNVRGEYPGFEETAMVRLLSVGLFVDNGVRVRAYQMMYMTPPVTSKVFWATDTHKCLVSKFSECPEGDEAYGEP